MIFLPANSPLALGVPRSISATIRRYRPSPTLASMRPETSTRCGATIASDTNGDIRIAYHDYANIYYVKQISGVWQASTTLNTGTSQSSPSLVVDYKNRETVLWQLSNGTNWNVYYSGQGAAYGQR